MTKVIIYTPGQEEIETHHKDSPENLAKELQEHRWPFHNIQPPSTECIEVRTWDNLIELLCMPEKPPKLTEMQKKIMTLIVTGITYKEIARKINRSTRQVFAQTAEIKAKLNVNSKAELIAEARRILHNIDDRTKILKRTKF